MDNGPMQYGKCFILLAVGFFLSQATPTHAISVHSDPAGFVKTPIQPGITVVSVPMHQFPKTRGVVSAVGSDSLTLTVDPGWASDELAPVNGYGQYLVVLRFDSDTAPGNEGDWWIVTANTNNELVLDTGADDLTSLIGAGDHIEVRRLVSLRDLFGSAGSLTLNRDSDLTFNEADDDAISHVDGLDFDDPIFYHDGTLAAAGFYQDGSYLGDGSTITIMPDQALAIFRATTGSSAKLASFGAVHITYLTHYLFPGPNTIGSPFPVAAGIADTNLLESGWLADDNLNLTDSDYFRPIIADAAFDEPVFYHDGSLVAAGWYQGADAADDFELAPARAFTFFINGADALRWRQPPAFIP